MLQDVLLQVFWQQTATENGLAAALRTNQHGHTLIGVQRVHLEPVGHHRQMPGFEPFHRLLADARQTAVELAEIVGASYAGR